MSEDLNDEDDGRCAGTRNPEQILEKSNEYLDGIGIGMSILMARRSRGTVSQENFLSVWPRGTVRPIGTVVGEGVKQDAK